MQIKENDIVSLTADAVYYTGKEIPGWVKNERWRVKSISGGRAVLGKSEDEKYEINSPVDVRYLLIENAEEGVPGRETSAATAKAPQNASPKTPPSTGNSGADTVSDRGVELIAKYEGCRLEAYLCPAGVWTIAYGGRRQRTDAAIQRSGQSAAQGRFEKIRRLCERMCQKGTDSFFIKPESVRRTDKFLL